MHDVAYRVTVKGYRKIVELEKVGYIYPGGLRALSNISLSVYEGDRIALVGHNGSGKTTLGKVLAGIYAPTEGKCWKDDSVVCGMVFQDPDDQLFCTSVKDDIAFGLLTEGISPDVAGDRVLETAELFGISNLLDREPHNLSYGQRKLVALASVLVMNPSIVILDEPTAGLDPEYEEKALEILDGYKGTLICISHDLFFLYHLCNRAVVLKQGKIHHDYSMGDLVSHRASLKEHGLDFTYRFYCCGTDFPVKTKTGEKGSEANESLISLRNVGYRYRDGTVALHGISLDVKKGERIGLIGANGAGKSTLALILSGVLKPCGEYFFEGRPVTDKVRGELWKRVGMVFQDPMDQLFCPSCREEVAFGPENMELDGEEVDNRVRWAMNCVNLAGYDDRVPHRLSGGEQRRLVLASVLSMRPEVLILDEPTNNLDPESESELIKILDSLESTLIIISHDLCFLSFLCDRAVVMHRGHIVMDLPFQDFMKHEVESLRLSHYHHHGYRQKCCRTIRELFYSDWIG
ncbi:ABC transporter ATP-binding protein [Thermodesulforhabdus norvegica]|uniref:Energy-coupling factor transport system ATP-binding protein n=1 Tax=Thermodesulforhabdus norvegica TaxID=39841 RepID=A0A1I4SNF9_9BACT|nr:ABC transporter ATP-binding protein [Thermodesulforhabdus norvegica]SFM66006.1 energy-coupling factor transport system ATP-binding protein [Thermodesulforhabdus norvegica]